MATFSGRKGCFVKIYDEIRRQSDTDFKMDVMKHKNKPKCSWIAAMFSITLNIFYLVEIILTVFVFFNFVRGLYAKSIFQFRLGRRLASQPGPQQLGYMKGNYKIAGFVDAAEIEKGQESKRTKKSKNG